MRAGKRIRAIGAACAAVCLIFASAVAASAEVTGYVDGMLVLVDEAGTTSDYVDLYHGEGVVSHDTMTWTDGGIHGQALQLDGRAEFLSVDYWQMQMPTMSFVAWVKWQGSPDGNADGVYGQRLFTMYYGEDDFLTVSLRMKRENVGTINDVSYGFDGIYMEYRLGGTEGVQRVCADPVYAGENYAVPLNEWHHYAVVMNGQSLCLYIDGICRFSEELMLGVADMQASELRLGGGIWGDPLLYAQIDDAALFSKALSQETIRQYASGADLWLQSEGTTTTIYTPTAPNGSTDVTTVTTTTPLQNYTSLRGGLPLWTWILIGVVAALFVISTVLVNIRAYCQKREESADADAPREADPKTTREEADTDE